MAKKKAPKKKPSKKKVYKLGKVPAITDDEWYLKDKDGNPLLRFRWHISEEEECNGKKENT